MSHNTYLDYAAATPMSDVVRAAMQPYYSDRFYNPSATYQAAINIKKDIEVARSDVAKILGARSGEMTFTAGGTEANNLAIRGILAQFPDANIVISSIEHDSVRSPAAQYDVREALVNEQGIVDVASLKNIIDDKTVLVSIMYANNEIGTIQPIKRIAETIKTIRQDRQKNGNKLPIYLHTDACQAANYLDLHVSRLGVDMMTLNGGKIYGPKQSGVLFVRAGVKITPIILGGGQEYNLRSGTENVAAIVGFAVALQETQTMKDKEVQRLLVLQQQFIEQIEEKIPEAVINGSQKLRLPNNIHVTIPGIDNERILIELDLKGVMAAAGSACSASKEESSHVLHACGLNDKTARSSLRFSMGRATTQDDVDYTIKTLVEILSK